MTDGEEKGERKGFVREPRGCRQLRKGIMEYWNDGQKNKMP
jgi:hypothetical protein